MHNRLYSLINLAGLALSLALVITVFSYTGAQRRTARTVPAYENAYAVTWKGDGLLCYGVSDRLSGLPEDAQAAKDLDSMCNRFEKKIHDLELTRMISIQTAPQIRLVQNNDTQMVEKIQSTIVNTIPLWKSQMVLALGVEHSAQAAAAQREVTDMTNELLRKNAEKLKMATIETAKESERGIVDMETLKATNESLISTLDEVMNIQREGRQKRAEAEEGLRSMEQELKAKLLEIQG